MEKMIEGLIAAAAYLGCSESTVKRLRKSGKITGERIGKYIRFSQLELDQYRRQVRH